MKIAIITAMPEESGAVLKGAKLCEKSLLSGRKRYHTLIDGHDVVLVEAGMGMLNAGWAATALAVEQPDLMISAGFGGAVLPGLRVGDAVVAEQLLHWGGESFEEAAVGFYGHTAVASTLNLFRGAFITCDVILDKKSLAQKLPAGTANPIIEMESAAIARVAAAYGIPFLGVRTVSDPWDEELYFSIDEFCDDTMRIRPAKVLATILKRPRIIPQLIRLALNSRVAAASLANSMLRLLHRI